LNNPKGRSRSPERPRAGVGRPIFSSWVWGAL